MKSVPIEPERLIDLLADSNIGAGILKARGAQVAAALAGNDTAAASFNIDFNAQRPARHAAGKPRHSAFAARGGTYAEVLRRGSLAEFGRSTQSRYPAWWLSHTETEQG